MDASALDEPRDETLTRSTFQDDLQQLIAASQGVVWVLTERACTLRDAAERLAHVLPSCGSAAEFLLVRSVLVDFAARALQVRAPHRFADLLPLITLDPSTGDLGATLLRCLSEERDDAASRSAGSIQKMRAARACALIKARCDEPRLKTAAIAAAVGVSEQYLSKLLRAHCGAGFRAVVRRARVERACALLTDSLASMKEIASTMGYSSTSQFDHDFRIECRLSPGAYRRMRVAAGRISPGPLKG